MSWHFLQEGAEASWEGFCWDGAPVALLKLTPTHGASCWPDSGTDPFTPSRFGTTSEHSTENRGEDQSTLFPAASPAKTLPQWGRAWDSAEAARDSGVTWLARSERLDPVTFSWKTHLCLLAEDLPTLSPILPEWGLMQSGELSERTTPAFPTIENGCGWWATPSARDWKDTPGMSKAREGDNPEAKEEAVDLFGESMEQKRDKGSNSAFTLKTKGKHRIDQLPRQVYAAQDGSRLFTAPSATTKETALAADVILQIVGVQDQLWRNANTGFLTAPHTPDPCSGTLNPEWVEWLMGWPIGWTGSESLATGRFQAWLHLHGALYSLPSQNPECN